MEQVFKFHSSSKKLIEKIVNDNHIVINHMILNKDEVIPEHNSNSNVYIIVINGTVSLQLNNLPTTTYKNGHIIHIPYNTKMNVKNNYEDQLEIFVIKSPNPKYYKIK